tara:strand:- start:886 stop:1275 length:390 start_codon:yes stop_codon:yes gene_type:complete
MSDNEIKCECRGEEKTPFEEKAREAMIEYGFNEMETHWDFHDIVKWKSGPRKGQFRNVIMTHTKKEERIKWKYAEYVRLAEKYSLPENWNEALREKLGNGAVNDFGFIGQDNWWKTPGNKETYQKRTET